MAMLAALSAVAGFVDAACFLALSQVFTAHVTGNFAALASALVKLDAATGLRLAVIVSFAGGAISAVFVAHAVGGYEREVTATATAPARVRRAVMHAEATWLLFVLVAHAALPGPLDPSHALARYAVAIFAGAAMGCQSALSRLPGDAALGAPTTVMTSNFSGWAMALGQRLLRLPHDWHHPRDPHDPHDHTLTRLSLQLGLFILGAAAGASGEHRFGVAVLAAPLAGLLILGATRVSQAA